MASREEHWDVDRSKEEDIMMRQENVVPYDMHAGVIFLRSLVEKMPEADPAVKVDAPAWSEVSHGLWTDDEDCFLEEEKAELRRAWLAAGTDRWLPMRAVWEPILIEALEVERKLDDPGLVGVNLVLPAPCPCKAIQDINYFLQMAAGAVRRMDDLTDLEAKRGLVTFLARILLGLRAWNASFAPTSKAGPTTP